MFKTVYRKLTKEQKQRGVIYSSALVRSGFNESESDTIHEVLRSDKDRWEKIDNLKDVSFFRNMARDFNWNVTNIVRN